MVFKGRDDQHTLLFISQKEYMITYDGEDFIIHWAAKGYLDMMFKPHKSGLRVYDPDGPRGLASYSFMETVESNMA